MNAPRILLVYGGHPGGRTDALRHALVEGLHEAGEALELRERRALDANIEDLIWARGLLLATPEHFGYMSGALKDFFDRTYYPAAGRTEGLPYALCISAGNDGTGTANAVQRIVTGYRWKAIAEPLIAVGAPDVDALQRCRELGATLAAGLAAGVF